MCLMPQSHQKLDWRRWMLSCLDHVAACSILPSSIQYGEHPEGAGWLHVSAKQVESATEQKGKNGQCRQAITRQLGVHPSFHMVQLYQLQQQSLLIFLLIIWVYDAVTGMSSAQGAGSSPFNDMAAQNGFQGGFQQSQQGSNLQSQPSLVSQTSASAAFQQSTGQPPFLVQYGTGSQGQCPLICPSRPP